MTPTPAPAQLTYLNAWQTPPLPPPFLCQALSIPPTTTINASICRLSVIRSIPHAAAREHADELDDALGPRTPRAYVRTPTRAPPQWQTPLPTTGTFSQLPEGAKAIQICANRWLLGSHPRPHAARLFFHPRPPVKLLLSTSSGTCASDRAGGGVHLFASYIATGQRTVIKQLKQKE